MRQSLFLLALFLIVVVQPLISPLATRAAGDYAAGEVLVRFVPGTPGAAIAAAHQANAAAPKKAFPALGLELVAVPPGQEQAALAAYERNPNVVYAELNYVRSIPEPLSHAGGETFPGDYYFDEQWALHNTGQEFYCIPFLGSELCFYIGTADVDIDYPEGLAISTGSSAITIAVLDTGVDYGHPDLQAKYGGGKDFVNDDDDPQDDHGHGTHVAGTAAALVNNPTGSPSEEEGVAGVAPLAALIAGKICDAAGMCPDDAIIDGLLWAAGCDTNPCGALRADVINMSIGAPSPSQAIDDAVQVAWNQGAVLVAAAGNSGGTAPSYPAAYANVLSVGAFDEDGLRAPFSNYGSWVQVAAPGNVIIAPWPMAGCAGAPQVPGDFGCYNYLSGTSMASPHVAGLAAMVLARPDVTSNAQAVDIVKQSADPAGAGSVPLDSWTQYGGVNLHDALSYGAGPAPNTAPVAEDLGIETQEGVAVVWTPDTGDADGDTLTCIAGPSSVAGGSVTVEADCSVGTYTPASGFTGADSFNYTVSDGELSGTGTVSVDVQASPPPPPAGAVHVGDLDAASVKHAKGAWGASVAVLIHDQDEAAAAGYTIEGTFVQAGVQIAASCTTGATGRCTISFGQFPAKDGKATFTVADVSGALSYDAAANHDPDSDSDGTVIQLSKN